VKQGSEKLPRDRFVRFGDLRMNAPCYQDSRQMKFDYLDRLGRHTTSPLHWHLFHAEN
jgi:hypothetical protein